jgi:4-methyl-5(b-hydroxyethyl)-thiazole monophosphate biosynthesis
MRALVPVANGNEDIELVSITDILTRCGIDVVIASIEDQKNVRLMQGLQIEADCRLADVLEEDFEAIVMAGGIPGAIRLAEASGLRSLLIRHHAAGAVLAAICLAPALVLEPAGVLDACQSVTGNPRQIKTRDQTYAPDAFTKLFGEKYDPTLRVCVDHTQRIVTSQAPGTAIEFSLAVVRMLAGDAVADTIDHYIMVAH